MGCGCVSQHQASLSDVGAVRNTRLFLHNPTDGEFVRSLCAEEQKDKKLLLLYFRHLQEGQFEATPQFVDLVRRRGLPQRFRWPAWRTISGWSSSYRAGTWERLTRQRPDPKTVDAIEKDLDRTFPNVEDFGEARKRQLASMLRAFAVLFPQVGYCQGMNFVAAFIILNAPEQSAEDAFFMLVQIMAKYQGSLLFCDGLPLLKLYTFQFRVLLERLFPEVHRHFAREAITPELYVTKWFLTMFTQPLPFVVAARLWDLLICDGLQSLVHLALATVKLLRSRLLRQPTDGILELLSLRGEGGLPTGGCIVQAALSLKQSSPCGPGLDARLAKLRAAWVRECPGEAADLERACNEFCPESHPQPLPHDATVPFAVAQSEAPSGLAARVFAFAARNREQAVEEPASDASMLLSLPASVEAALHASDDASTFTSEGGNSIQGENCVGGTERSIGEDWPVGLEGTGSTKPGASPASAAAVKVAVTAASSGSAGSPSPAAAGAPASPVEVVSSPHVIAAEARVELKSSTASFRPAGARASRLERPTGGSASSGLSPVARDATGASERTQASLQLPRVSGSSGNSRRSSSLGAAGSDPASLAAGASPRLSNVHGHGLGAAVVGATPSGSSGGSGRSARSARSAARSHAEGSGPRLRLPIASQEVGSPIPESPSGTSGISIEGSPPARQPELGRQGAGGLAKESRSGGYSRLMSPLREDWSPSGEHAAVSSRGMPMVALCGMVGKDQQMAGSPTPLAHAGLEAQSGRHRSLRPQQEEGSPNGVAASGSRRREGPQARRSGDGPRAPVSARHVVGLRAERPPQEDGEGSSAERSPEEQGSRRSGLADVSRARSLSPQPQCHRSLSPPSHSGSPPPPPGDLAGAVLGEPPRPRAAQPFPGLREASEEPPVSGSSEAPASPSAGSEHFPSPTRQTKAAGKREAWGSAWTSPRLRPADAAGGGAEPGEPGPADEPEPSEMADEVDELHQEVRRDAPSRELFSEHSAPTLPATRLPALAEAVPAAAEDPPKTPTTPPVRPHASRRRSAKREGPRRADR